MASFAKAGISFASMAMVDVGVRAVQSGLCSLRAQALRVGTCAQSRQADQLAKHADSLPISTHSLFGEGLQNDMAKANSSARTYAAMADGFVQSGVTRPRPIQTGHPEEEGGRFPPTKSSKMSKPFTGQKKTAQGQNQRQERQEWEGLQDQTQCPGPKLDLRGSRHGSH